MVKIFGTKFFDHDCGFFLLDTSKKSVFGVDTERVTRIKHDNSDIDPVIARFNGYFKKGEIFTHSNSTFNHPSFSWVNEINKIRLRKVLRKIYRPKSIAEVATIERKSLNEIQKDSRKCGKKIENEYQAAKRALLKTHYYFSEKKAKEKVLNYFRETLRKNEIRNTSITFYDHALCHAAAAYYFSPFEPKESLVFTLDGWGDGFHSKLFRFQQGKWEELAQSKAPVVEIDGKKVIGSIGTIYRRFTKALGFKTNSEEGKVEALAAYSKPDQYYLNLLKKAVSIDKEKLAFVIHTKRLRLLYDIESIALRVSKIGREKVAAAVQRWSEDIVVEYLNCVQKRYAINRICIGGGVMANVMINLAIFERTKFNEMYVFPAPGDSGTAAGGAILKAIELGEDVSWLKKNTMPYFGPSYTNFEIKKVLMMPRFNKHINYKFIKMKDEKKIVETLLIGKIVALFQGRMEYGPRALGNRTILSNALDPSMRTKMNDVKGRHDFQPICPMILEEEREKLFEKTYSSKNMTVAFRMKKKYQKKLFSAVHVDGTARAQFIEESDNPRCYRLLKYIKRKTGYGVILNTSFNKHGRTIVMTPEDALTDFLDMQIDYLWIGNYLVSKKS